MYQLFEKEAITTVNSKLADKELSVIVEVIDRPDLEQKVIQKVLTKPRYVSHSVLSDALSSNKKEK